MRKADADIYYQRTQDSITGVVAAFCRCYQKKFVFASASEFDCTSDFPYLPQRHARILYRYGLRRAHLVIAQTMMQQRLLRENFSIDSVVIPNCAADYGSLDGAGMVASGRGRRVLWIGGFAPVKRLELLLDVAEHLGDLQFDVVGDGNRESEYVQCLLSRAKSLHNVCLHGKVPHARVHEFYRRAAALVCTSHAEGFPNVFLEAWAHGLPIVTTFDPDNLIVNNAMGIVARDAEGLASGIRTLLGDPQRSRQISEAARQYYLENHTIDAVMPRYEKIFREIVNPTPSVAVKKCEETVCQ
jgi:glycosyltransferase involved in cell wall biosynthesis